MFTILFLLLISAPCIYVWGIDNPCYVHNDWITVGGGASSDPNNVRPSGPGLILPLPEPGTQPSYVQIDLNNGNYNMPNEETSIEIRKIRIDVSETANLKEALKGQSIY